MHQTKETTVVLDIVWLLKPKYTPKWEYAKNFIYLDKRKYTGGTKETSNPITGFIK